MNQTKRTMSQREIINRIRLYKQQIETIEKYRKYFLEEMTPRQLSEYTDSILDRMIEDLQNLENYNNDKK